MALRVRTRLPALRVRLLPTVISSMLPLLAVVRPRRRAVFIVRELTVMFTLCALRPSWPRTLAPAALKSA